MVLVAVGQDDAAHRLPVLLQVRDVGDDEVDAEHLGLGEREAAVDDEDLVVDLDDGDVLADLAHPAERDDAQRIGHSGLLEESHLFGVVGGFGLRSRDRG